MQRFFTLLSVHCVLASFCDYASWQDGSPSFSQRVSRFKSGSEGKTWSPCPPSKGDWLALTCLPWAMCLPLSQSLTTGETDALDQMPSLDPTLSLEWAWWEVLPRPQKPQGIEVGRGGSPQTWEVVTGNRVYGKGLARKPHTSTARVSVPTSVILWGPSQAQSAGIGSCIH